MMKKTNLQLMMVLAAFVWAGMVAGISFLEAPVKFTAPGVTLEIGLGIGRLVFGCLNKIELIFGALLLAGALFTQPVPRIWATVLTLAGILLLQTFWLLPALDVRALAIIAGNPPAESMLHLVYVVLEVIKLLLLLLTGMQVFQYALREHLPARVTRF